MKEILLRKADELSGACRNYFETLKTYLKENNLTTFTNRSAGTAFRIAHTTVKRYNYDLHNAGFIKINTDKKVKTFTYQITTTEEYEQLKNKINNALDEVLSKIKAIELNDKKPPIRLNQPTIQNEPIKASNTKPTKAQPSKTIKEDMPPKKEISERLKNAYNLLLQHSSQHPETLYTTKLLMQLSGKSQKSVQVYLSELTQLQAIEKTMQGSIPYYKIIHSTPLTTNH
jgi:DNA-binding transcriptional regulator YhcF (GntR family)